MHQESISKSVMHPLEVRCTWELDPEEFQLTNPQKTEVSSLHS